MRVEMDQPEEKHVNSSKRGNINDWYDAALEVKLRESKTQRTLQEPPISCYIQMITT